jgi:hypothetical protein
MEIAWRCATSGDNHLPRWDMISAESSESGRAGAQALATTAQNYASSQCG